MPDFLRWLLSEPLVWLIVASWVFSMVGGQMQKAARKAAQEQRKRGGAPAEPERAGDRAGRPPRRDAEEIAREIRRAMGLERAEPTAPSKPAPRPAAKPAPRPAAKPTVRARPAGIGGAEAPRRVDYDEVAPRVTVVYDDARPRVSLRDEFAARDAKQVAATSARELSGHGVPGAHLGDKLRDRHLRVRGGLRRGVLDLSRPASAIVAMEVLGPPVALREPGSQRF